MLKSIADEFYLGTIEVFSRVKVLFVHAADTTVYIWSLKYVEEGPAYELWLEDPLTWTLNLTMRLSSFPKLSTFIGQ
ncbi:unnamed protein product [Mucor hiemalis]